MAANDKADAQKDKITGKVKEGAGKLTGDERTEAEGKSQNAQGKFKEGVEDFKEGVEDLKDKAKGFGDGLKNN